MTRIEVSGAAVCALGDAIDEVTAGLAQTPAHVTLAEGLPPGSTASALDDVLGGWALERGRLARQLAGLAGAARAAGAAYLQVERDATTLFEHRDGPR